MEQDYMKCPFCGGRLIWQSTAMASEVSDDYEGDEEAVVNWLTCDKCGRDFEVYDPVKEERKTNYKEYWDGN